jgi:hypothetical protein
LYWSASFELTAVLERRGCAEIKVDFGLGMGMGAARGRGGLDMLHEAEAMGRLKSLVELTGWCQLIEAGTGV